MKNSVVPAVIIITALAAYSIGANNTKPAPTCCCEHLQQIADDMHKQRIFLEKSLTLEDPGELIIPAPKFKTPQSAPPVPKARR